METHVLDHGYIELIESWGSDERIIESARMSTFKSFRTWGDAEHIRQCPNFGDKLPRYPLKCEMCNAFAGDETLLEYLYKNDHLTPFEMAGATFEIQAPIFVFREWQRHRTQSYNELSARYTPLPYLDYHPTLERCLNSSKKNKQAGSVAESQPEEIEEWLAELERMYALIEGHYRSGLAHGVPKEIARTILPAGRYSRMRASANLRNWMQFLTLRMDESAQWEIRQYANVVAETLEVAFPRSMKLFTEKLGAH